MDAIIHIIFSYLKYEGNVYHTFCVQFGEISFDKMVITTKFQIINPHFGTILAGIKTYNMFLKNSIKCRKNLI